MSWLDRLEARGAEARKASVPKKAPAPRSEVQQIVYQVRAPSAGDPGEIDFGFYLIEGDTLTLTDMAGKPLGSDCSRTVPPGADPFSIARNMIYNRRKPDGANFNRRLPHARQGWL